VRRKEKLKRRVFEQTDICPGQYVLDLGCGTATLAIMRACFGQP